MRTKKREITVTRETVTQDTKVPPESQVTDRGQSGARQGRGGLGPWVAFRQATPTVQPLWNTA